MENKTGSLHPDNQKFIHNKTAIIFFIIFDIIIFWKLVLPGYFIGGDIREFILQTSFFDSLNINYNNYQFCGVPSSVHFSGLNYIFSFNFLGLFFSVKTAFIFHLIILQLFFYKFLRLYCKNLIPAITAVLMFSFGGYTANLFYKGHNTFFYAVSWGIANLYFSIVFFRTCKFKQLIFLFVSAYLQMTCGNPYIVIFSFSLIFFVIIYELLCAESAYVFSTIKKTGIKLIIIVLVIVGGFFAGSSNFVKTNAVLEDSIKKTGFNLNESKRYSYSFGHLINIFVPGFFGSSQLSNFWDNSFEDVSGYVSVLYLIIFFYGLPIIINNRKLIYLFLISLLFLVISMADIFPLYNLLFQFFPVFKIFRGPVRFLFFFSFFSVFFISVLFDNVLSFPPPRKIKLKIIMVLSVLFIVAVKLNIMHFINDIVQSLFEGHNKLSYFFRKMMINQYTAESSIITFLLFILFYSTIFIFIDRKKSKILLTLVLCVELFLFFNVYSFVKINKNAVLNNNFYKKLKMLSGDDRIFFVNDFRNINDHLLYKIKSLNAYNPAMPFKFIEYIFLSNQEKLNFEYEKLSNRIGKININSAVFDMTNTRYVISPQEFSEHGYQLINKIDGYSIYKNVYAWNYVEVFSEWQVLNEKEITQNLKNLKRGEKKLFLHNMPEIKSNHENIQYKISDYVEISKDDKYLIKFNVDVCNDAVIFLPIMFDKFFEAYVNGKKTDIMRSNKIFISFPVKKGFNHIELLYNPDYSVLKFILSGILFFAAGAVIYKKTVI